MRDLTSIAIIAICIAGIAFVSRVNFLTNRDAGNGWRYIYWQPWRKWLIGIVLAIFVLAEGWVIWLLSSNAGR